MTGPSISIQATNEVALRDYTTLRLGGPAARLVSARDEEAIVSAVRAADSADTPLLVLGGGSNLVISDAGFAGTCVLVANTGTTIERSGDGEVVVTAEAGTDWDEFVAHTVAEGLGGLECLSGIPGLVGACPVQNIGAYGVEIAQLLLSVDLLERASGTVRTVPAAELGLGFRVSVLKDTEHAVVLRARFRLRTDGRSAPIRFAELARTLGVAIGERVPVAAARQAVLGLRRSKGMVLDETDHDTWSVGSFFMNPILTDAELSALLPVVEARTPGAVLPSHRTEDGKNKLSAAWLIERSGFGRGFAGPGGRVALSGKHCLALTNRGGAATADLLALAAQVRDGVHAAFGLRLHPEPVLVNCEL